MSLNQSKCNTIMQNLISNNGGSSHIKGSTNMYGHIVYSFDMNFVIFIFIYDIIIMYRLFILWCFFLFSHIGAWSINPYRRSVLTNTYEIVLGNSSMIGGCTWLFLLHPLQKKKTKNTDGILPTNMF